MAPHTTLTDSPSSQPELLAKKSVETLGLPTSAPSKTQEPGATTFSLEEHPIDATPPLKVIVIGAGIAGINAGILFPIKVPHLSLTIYEKNAEVGGTWFENIYPGVRCDLPAHVYQSTFSPNPAWSEHYATGPEILEYWKSVARKYEVYKYIRFSRRIKKAEWNVETKRWEVTVENVETGEVVVDEADVLVTAIGHFNAWKLPEYPGIEEFEGHLRHSSNWDPTFEPEGKRIAIIGNGASGLQITPQLQKVASHIDHYVRNPTWVATSFGGEERKLEPFTPDQLSSFQDPATYHAFRKPLESQFFRRFSSIFKGSDTNIALRNSIVEKTVERLKDKPELVEGIFPSFSPSCRRLTPGPGYLEALTKDNLEYIRTPIKRFTKGGIETVDGVERKVDAIICSTGANVSFAPPFPIVSSGIDLSEAWKPTGSIGFPKTYLGVAAPKFPNFFFIGGPSATGYAGTIPHSYETQAVYIAKILRKIATQGIVSITPSDGAADEFHTYADAFWPKTVLSEECSSWYNGGVKGGRVRGLWPGSSTHATLARREPRWEDFVYERKSANRFAYFGNGWSSRELREEDVDLTPYLRRPEEVDLRSYHEGWWDA
ncbi:hypothetical protein FN846DRAFT_1000864 [Sphaerosporella brunnea]|uniref:FAD/NAD(P)-binding domain-containing protein n=1 Tax=Sphaerosporella brunnea TaxID=1250544 RepID=A0A5J5F557_9PEZI|nr:hypothetical protein FN846DRAFT_1000864 [Sphaerosporella brunnea]